MTGIIWDLDDTLYQFYPPAKQSIKYTWNLAYEKDILDDNEREQLMRSVNGEYLFELKFWESLYDSKYNHINLNASEKFLSHVISSAWQITNSRFALWLSSLWWSQFYQNITLEPWVIPVFDKLITNQVKIGLLSNSPKEIGLQKLFALGLNSYFTEGNTVWAYDTDRFKPNEVPFELLSLKLNCRANDILVVGDNYNTDILGAQNAGMWYHLYEKGKEDLMIDRIYQFGEMQHETST